MRLICKDQIQEKKESKRINQMSIFTEKMSFYNDGQYSSEKKNCKFQMITLKKYTAKYYLETKPKKKKICFFFYINHIQRQSNRNKMFTRKSLHFVMFVCLFVVTEAVLKYLNLS